VPVLHTIFVSVKAVVAVDDKRRCQCGGYTAVFDTITIMTLIVLELKVGKQFDDASLSLSLLTLPFSPSTKEALSSSSNVIKLFIQIGYEHSRRTGTASVQVTLNHVGLLGGHAWLPPHYRPRSMEGSSFLKSTTLPFYS
jgi:hypothetical protein